MFLPIFVATPVEVLKTPRRSVEPSSQHLCRANRQQGNLLPRSKKTFFYLAILVVALICLNVFFRVGFNMTAMFFPQCEVRDVQALTIPGIQWRFSGLVLSNAT